MNVSDKEGYYFDRIQILSTQNKNLINQELLIDRLKKESLSCRVVRSNAWGFASRIELTAPSALCLTMLQESEAIIGSGSRINYLEIAHDTFMESSEEANERAKWMCRTLRKKYSYATTFRGAERKTNKQHQRDLENGLCGEFTFYSVFTVSARLKLVVYVRDSKINRRPCIHTEWRLRGADSIFKHSRISRIRDLVGFDFKAFFDSMDDKYLVKERIDVCRLGLWLAGIDGRRTMTKRMLIGTGHRAERFLQDNNIETFSDLVHYFKREKNRVSGNVGFKTDLDMRIMALRNFDRFRDRIS
ncbi:MAG: hypothetical protein HPY65_18150 [Syntrophaceae bacterium]|nr:hypothetical protein [Syntrophaceae bacterium]